MSIVLPNVLSAFSAQEEEVMRDAVVEIPSAVCYPGAGVTSTLLVAVSTSLSLERTGGFPIHWYNTWTLFGISIPNDLKYHSTTPGVIPGGQEMRLYIPAETSRGGKL